MWQTHEVLCRESTPEGKSILVPEKHKWCYVSIKIINSATQAIWPPVWLCPKHTLWTLHSSKWRKRHLWGVLSTFCHKKSIWISSWWRCFTVLSHFNSDDDWWQPNWPQWSNSLHKVWCRTKQENVPRTKPVSLACQVIWEVHCVGLVSCKENLKQRAVPDTFHPPPPPPICNPKCLSDKCPSNSPLTHPLAVSGHMHSVTHSKWLPSHIQSSESTFYALIFGLQHQTICRETGIQYWYISSV